MAFASVAAITLLLRLRRLFSRCSEAGDGNDCGGIEDVSSPKDAKTPDKDTGSISQTESNISQTESNNVDETSPDSDPLSENLLFILEST